MWRALHIRKTRNNGADPGITPSGSIDTAGMPLYVQLHCREAELSKRSNQQNADEGSIYNNDFVGTFFSLADWAFENMPDLEVLAYGDFSYGQILLWCPRIHLRSRQVCTSIVVRTISEPMLERSAIKQALQICWAF